MDSIYYFLSSSEDSDEENVAITRRKLRDKSNILDMPEIMFVKLFRLSKEAFLHLFNQISPSIKQPLRITSVPPILKLAITLRFLAQGSYQQSVGQEYLTPVCQATVSRVLEEIIIIIEEKVCPSEICFEMTEQEKLKAKKDFFLKSGIPNTIGAVDGTHIRIIRPKEREHLYYSRKGYHTLNVMVICDHALKIRAVNARHGGASHDSAVWATSAEKYYLENKFRSGNKEWILGDSGYPLEPWLITPYRAAEDNSPESNFNHKHPKARNTIERVFGLLKGRFRCLLSARELHYNPEKAAKIFNVCAALHNICLKYRVDLHSDLVVSVAECNVTAFNDSGNREAQNIRDNIRDSLRNLPNV